MVHAVKKKKGCIIDAWSWCWRTGARRTFRSKQFGSRRLHRASCIRSVNEQHWHWFDHLHGGHGMKCFYLFNNPTQKEPVLFTNGMDLTFPFEETYPAPGLLLKTMAAMEYLCTQEPPPCRPHSHGVYANFLRLPVFTPSRDRAGVWIANQSEQFVQLANVHANRGPPTAFHPHRNQPDRVSVCPQRRCRCGVSTRG